MKCNQFSTATKLLISPQLQYNTMNSKLFSFIYLLLLVSSKSISSSNVVPNQLVYTQSEIDLKSLSSFSNPIKKKRSTNVYTNKLKFLRNQFNFKYQWPNENSITVGKILLNQIDQLDTVRFSVKATRDPKSQDLVFFDSKSFEIRFNQSFVKWLNIYESHYFKLFAYDSNRNILTSCSLRIDISGSNQTNRPPVFETEIYEAQIVENNAPDTLVTRVDARDDDLGENGHLTYHFAASDESNSLPFQIKSDTGEIYAKKVLNRELKEFYKLNVMAIDNGPNRLSSLAQVIVRVLPQGDAAPRFIQKEFNLTLADSADYWLKPTVLKVSALDVDNSSSLVYSLSGSLNDMNTFEIDSQTGYIRLVSKLNSELKNQYKLNIIAKDLSQPARATYAPLSIFVEDVHVNPPVFTAPFYEFILFENVPIGYFVGRVVAVDKRKRSFDIITYAIQLDSQNDAKFPFSINDSNGTIQTVKKVNKNFKQGYEFNVIASMISNINKKVIANSTVRVKVKILDINDQVPLFAKSSYRINITEESSIGLPLLILSTKNIRDLNSILEYTIESGNENDMFSLVKQDNDKAFLSLERSNLNYKKQSSYDLNVKVMDQDGLYSIANVKVAILPKDSNMPRFSQDIYSFQINENASINSLVGSIQASSPNSMDAYSSRIVYKLISNSETSYSNENLSGNDQSIDQDSNDLKQNYFKLDELTGNLFVSSYLDREKYESITLYVTATNYNDKNQLIDHAIVQIQILDVNDNPPVFTRQFYELNVYRNTKIGSFLKRVEAIDKDLGQNGQVRYHFESRSPMPIAIDPLSGVIRLTQFLDEVNSINLTLIATDLGEVSLSSSINVLVQFLDQDDLAPVFDRNILIFYLYENQPVGTIIGEVKARDPNAGQQANIIYKLLENNDLFELKPSGKFNEVLLVSKFIGDLETRSSRNTFDISLRAYSANLHTDCLIRVFLKDLNDNSPSVPKTFKVVFNNYKNYFLTEKFAFVPVQDPDASSNLTFRLLDSIGKQVVDLDSKSGKLTFKPILNSNNQINVSFMIGINDGSRELVTTCELIVLMLSDNLIAESVTLSLPNLEIKIFLNLLYDRLITSLLSILSKSSMSNIHIFNIMNSSFGLNISLSVSYDYEKDIFMPANILKQILYLNSKSIENDLKISKLIIYEDASCAIEPCLNYQQCTNSIKFQSASPDFIHSSYIQFRAIQVQHDFKCACPIGYTGTNSSFMCDLEINLCYSNPCGNNGVCMSLESSFMCICDADFSGRFCELNLKKLKCCENDHQIQPVSKMSLLQNNNRKSFSNVSQTVNGKCAASLTASNSFVTDEPNNLVCKGNSKCRNLILGGILCDKCGTGSSEDAINYNEFCELRTKHFPQGKHAYLALPGIKNRFRFKLKLTFATVKSDGFLFYNGRLNKHATPNGLDFVALKIEDSHLKFSYSLGDNFVNELVLSDLDVSDGKWRTVTIDYKNRNVTLSLDNDNSASIDACELAYSQNKTQQDCYRVNSSFKLPDKCFNQVETCFRYFDLNGPLRLGQGPDLINREENSKSVYEGCISDVFLNEKLIDLQRDAIVDYNTEIGCSPKLNYCKKINNHCAKCQHVWLDKVKCDCSNSQLDEESMCAHKLNQEENVYSLKGTGYLAMKEVVIKNHIDIQFSIRLPSIKKIEKVVLIYFELFTKLNESKMTDNSKLFYLYYNLEQRRIQLISENLQLDLLSMAFELDDGYWHSLKLSMFLNSNKINVKLSIDEYFKSSSKLINLEFDQLNEKFLKAFIGGNANLVNKVNLIASSITGCIKKIEQDAILLRETVDMIKGCSFGHQCEGSNCKTETTNICLKNEPVCYNNGQCSFIEAKETINCSCSNGFKGKYCQYENRGLTRSLLTNQNNCPAKWWGQEPGICGPCNCDESKNFSPDCNKTSGQCECKPKFYKKVNKITKEEQCVPCDCYLEGSASLQCESLTGQCSCLSGAGITGRKCDQCVSPFAEMTTKGNECRQLSSSECPRAFKFDIWWPRTGFNKLANASCPKGSVGIAYRFCNEANGWSNVVDLRDCKSLKLINSQLAKWSKMLLANNSQLNSYQALQLAEDLNKITLEADLEDELNQEEFDYSTGDAYMSTSTNSLYANDLIVIKNLTKYIVQYEIENAPSYLYIQDKHFMENLFSTLNRILSKKYEKKLKQLLISTNSFLNDSFIEETKTSKKSRFQLTDLIIVLDKYLQSLVVNNQYNSLAEKLEVNFNNFKLYMNTVKGQAFAHTSMPFIKFKLITTQNSMQKINFIAMNSIASSLPNSLMIEPAEKEKTKLIKISHNYRVVSNILMVNLQAENQKQAINSTVKSLYLVIDFTISNLFDYSNSKMSLKMSDANYLCVYLNQETNSWSTKGARLVSYDYETNTVKCSYDHFSIYAVVTSVNGFVSLGSQPVSFSLAAYIVQPVTFLVLLVTIVLLISLSKFSSPLTQIYLNLCINILIMQVIFLFGVNNNSSQILCKFIAIAQHFFHLSIYLWMLLIVIHLYRILTELRDINKQDSRLPVFYYVISLAVPVIIVSLTLGLKQDVYTNYSFLSQLYNGNLFSSYFSSTLYCWLCVNSTSFYDVFYVFLLPISIVSVFVIVLSVLCFNESKKTTFKQADVPIVKQNMFICLFILLPMQLLVSFFIFMTIYSSGSYGSMQEFTVYQYLYLGSSMLQSIIILFALILLNKTVRSQLMKSWNSLCSKNKTLNESLDTSKLKLYNRSPNLKDAITLKAPTDMTNFNPNLDIFKLNPKYILDYRDFQAHCNSISTTTTSGTLDDMDYQSNYLKEMGMSTSNGYLSHLANTTNTESTANESEFTTHFDFNRPPTHSNTTEINESDVIDVGKILKSRLINSQTASSEASNLKITDADNYQIRNEFSKGQIIEKQSNHAVKKATPSLSLFWPNTVAECDTSFLDGSAVYSPTKLPYSKNLINVPEIVNVNASASKQNRILQKNNSYNSNSSASHSASNSNNCSNSTSSLILNSISTAEHTANIVPSQNKNDLLNYVSPQKLVAILTHTGSPTTTDNESGNETRV